LLSGAVAESGYFQSTTLEQLLGQHASGRRDHSATIWKLLMLDAFLRKVDQPQADLSSAGGVYDPPVAQVQP
jgi:asparagine synthase (glutamine-hydrolysing)